MESESERSDDEQAKTEDPGSSEAPVSGQPGGGLDGPDGPDGAEESESDEESSQADG